MEIGIGVGIGLSLLALAEAPPGPEPLAETILFQGHSLVDDFLEDGFNSWLGVTRAVQSIIIGSPTPYFWDHSADAKGVDSRAWLLTPGVDVYDYAEGGPLDAGGGTAGSPNTLLHHNNLFCQLAWDGGARPLLYAIWPYTSTGTPGYIAAFPADPLKDMTDWRAKIDAIRPHYERIVGYVHARMPEGGAPLRLVPADALMAELYDTALAGGLIGVTATQAGFYAAMFTDDIHLTTYGKYAVACLHWACIYGQSPVGLSTAWVNKFETPYSGMPTGPQAAQLQAIAWAVAQADPLGPWGAQIPDDPYAGAGGGGAAAWWTPETAQVITDAADPPVTSATLAWSYRYAAGTIDGAPSTKLFESFQFSFVDLNGGSDGGGRGIGSQLVNASWSNIVTMTAEPGYDTFLMPATTYNFVLLISSAGALSGGHTAELWVNGALVRSSSSALSDCGLQDLYMLANRTGAALTPGETQGWWYSNDTAVSPVTVFDTLFDGANGLRDLVDTTIGGVVPDAVQIGPPVIAQ